MNNPLSIEDIAMTVHRQFRDAAPNGWLLGWDVNRCFDLISSITAPHRTTNCTSFDYGWCNWFEVRIDNGKNGEFLTITIKISYIVPAFSIHWTQYESPTSGAVISVPPKVYEVCEYKIRAALENGGFFELPDEWYEQIINGVELELSGAKNVTLGKCLFNDYEG